MSYIYINGVAIPVQPTLYPNWRIIQSSTSSPQVVPQPSSYVTTGPSFQNGVETHHVDGTTFMCTKPVQARIPSGTSNIKHLVVQDASQCQLECMEAGRRNCNVYEFRPSKYAPNCTIGYMPTFTNSLASTTDPSGVAGYCIASQDAVNSIYFPPFH